MTIDCEQIKKRERAQEKEEDVAEVHLCVLPKYDEQCQRLYEDENGADVGGKGVVLEVDSHSLYALRVPLELAELDDILVVHLRWADHGANVPKSVKEPDEEEEQAEAISHYSEGNSRLILGHVREVLICHARNAKENHKDDRVYDHNHHYSRLQAKDPAAAATLRNFSAVIHQFYVLL